MTDVELAALTAVVNADTEGAAWERTTGGYQYAPDYRPYRALRAELVRRGVLRDEDPKPEKANDDGVPY